MAEVSYSLAMIAGWDRIPPVSVTRAPMLGNSTDQIGEVIGQTSTSPASPNPVELGLTPDHPEGTGIAAGRRVSGCSLDSSDSFSASA
jgi:hypothetical protein